MPNLTVVGWFDTLNSRGISRNLHPIFIIASHWSFGGKHHLTSLPMRYSLHSMVLMRPTSVERLGRHDMVPLDLEELVWLLQHCIGAIFSHNWHFDWGTTNGHKIEFPGIGSSWRKLLAATKQITVCWSIRPQRPATLRQDSHLCVWHERVLLKC